MTSGSYRLSEFWCTVSRSDRKILRHNDPNNCRAIEYQPSYSGRYKLREGFSYTPGGLPASKSLRYKIVNSIVTLSASFAYNNEGQRTAITYPRGWSDASGMWQQDPAVTYESSFDSEARLTGLTRKQTGISDAVIASGATYNLNGQMLTATIQGAARTWQYNDRGQLTRETAGSLMDFEYTFSATENDGRVSQRKDWISGEDVQFQYEVLGRLSSATATGAGVAWSQSFTHDGFGNLTQRSGSGTPLSVTVNAKNQVAGVGYDANGNQASIGSHGPTYDVENRLIAVTNVAGIGTESYGYSVRGERLLVKHTAPGNSTPFAQELRLYDTNSQLLAVFDVVCAAPCTTANDPCYPVEKTDKKRVYFAGKLVQVGAQAAVTDRLGSLIAHGSTRHRYYPYGEAIGTQEWDKPQFATYTRDGATGLDDAMNRQYDRIWGRLTSPDPYQASAGPADPGSWNRYAYVQGDPVNFRDRLGLFREEIVIIPPPSQENPDPNIPAPGIGAPGLDVPMPDTGDGENPGVGGGAPIQGYTELKLALEKDRCAQQVGALTALVAQGKLTTTKFATRRLGKILVENKSAGIQTITFPEFASAKVGGDLIELNGDIDWSSPTRATGHIVAVTWNQDGFATVTYTGETRHVDIVEYTRKELGLNTLSSSQMLTLVLLHEFGHIMGLTHDKINNKNIARECLGMQ